MEDRNHQTLFEAYLEDLRWAQEVALERRRNRIESMTETLDGDEARAFEMIEGEAPPCTDHEVIGVVRKFWLACDELNQTGLSQITPEEFIFHALKDREPKLHDFLRPIPYWPMGQNEDGRWV